MALKIDRIENHCLHIIRATAHSYQNWKEVRHFESDKRFGVVVVFQWKYIVKIISLVFDRILVSADVRLIYWRR